MGSEEERVGFWKKPFRAAGQWARRQSMRAKVATGSFVGLLIVVLLWAFVQDHDYIFLAAQSAHAFGISVLIYKLLKNRTCAGLSLKSQELTAIYLAVRLYCSYVMEHDIHTILDLATLFTTLWVVYMIRFVVRSSYMEENDNFALYYVVIPCAVIACYVHPSTGPSLFNRISWAFSVYLESVSVLPQLRVMQNAKSEQVIEPFTAHYVFSLGVARFLNCAHWILQIVNTHGSILTILGYGLWPCLVVLSEIIQTFILAEFCYYYVKSVVEGNLVLRLPAGTV